MLRVGITGQAGFVGSHLFNTLGLEPQKYVCVPFDDSYFENDKLLRQFVRQCDVIIHLAAVNRNPDIEELYRTNIRLGRDLIAAMEGENITPHVLFSSSTQEERDNEYGRSKRECRLLFENWARRNSASFTGMIIPNVFGPFARPNYNSFVATFCHRLTHGETPEIIQDSEVDLIYVGSLVRFIIGKINEVAGSAQPALEKILLVPDFRGKVTEILEKLKEYKSVYFEAGNIPFMKDRSEVNLFNTFRSYIEHDRHFPIQLKKHEDVRGIFVETLKLGVGGQVSFSTTKPGITRGNHFHTRKIERFTVIHGRARIQLRKIGSDKIFDFYLDGNVPSYVDMPIWHVHNITNTGDTELYTQFWINEWYDPADGDTYAQKV
jgi:UDP-2-acetamido-2,6-beta-L-arabino-hexul-4-ose reductase